MSKPKKKKDEKKESPPRIWRSEKAKAWEELYQCQDKE